MPSCIFRYCKNNSNLHSKKHGITFHLFPINDERKNRWTEIIQKEREQDNWKPTKSTIVCSDHFDDSDMYITESGLRRLSKDAVPTVIPLSENSDEKKWMREYTRNRIKVPPDSTTGCVTRQEIDIPVEAHSQKSPDTNFKVIVVPAIAEVRIPPGDTIANEVPSEINTSIIGAAPADSQTTTVKVVIIPKLPENPPVGRKRRLLNKTASETPGEIKLRKMLQKKIGYIQKYLNTIKTLRRKTTRLKKTNVKLKSEVTILKKKRFLNGQFECKYCRNLLDSDDA